MDGKTRSDLVAFANSHSPALNATFVRNMLEGDGFAFERQTVSAGHAPKLPARVSHERQTLFYKAPGGEAIAVIFRDDNGKSAIVLNTISHVEQAK